MNNALIITRNSQLFILKEAELQFFLSITIEKGKFPFEGLSYFSSFLVDGSFLCFSHISNMQIRFEKTIECIYQNCQILSSFFLKNSNSASSQSPFVEILEISNYSEVFCSKLQRM